MNRRFITCIVYLSFVVFNIKGQVSFYNDGVLKLTGNTDILYVRGSVTNTASASLTNNGNFYVSGDLTNNQSFASAGTGRLLLNGTSPQSVNGSQTFKTFNLTTDNSSGITLNNNLSVSGTHTFTNGIITTSSTPNYLIYESGSSYIGSNDSRHVNGWVKKIGSTNFTFPVGDNTYERPIALESISLASEFDVKYNKPTPFQTQLLLPVRSVAPGEYWTINKISGGTANVHMNWDVSKVNLPGYSLGEIVVAKFVSANWTNQGGAASGNVATTGDITSNSQLAFGDFVIGSKLEPLALEFLAFTAKRNGDYTEISWITIDEIDTDNFKVERSENGVDFDTLVSIPTTSNGSLTEYVYKDFRPITTKTYYRVRCVDVDATSKLTKILVIFPQVVITKRIQVVNPVKNRLIQFSGFDDKYISEYQVTDIAGRIITGGAIKIQPGLSNTIQLPDNLSKGLYMLNISNPSNQFRQIVLVD